MKKTLMYAVAIMLIAGMTAEAKKDEGQGKKGAVDHEMKKAEAKANADVDTAKEIGEEKSKEATAQAEEAKKKGKSEEAKGKSEEMKKATSEKKEAQKAAKESGEKST